MIFIVDDGKVELRTRLNKPLLLPKKEIIQGRPVILSLSSHIKLNNGLSIPSIHLGVYLTGDQETIRAVRWALEASYRGFDSAQMYRSERQVENSIPSWLSDEEKQPRKPGTRRCLLHLEASVASYEAARKSIKQSIETSSLGYIDLVLPHSPYGGKSSRLAS
jgi:diketogulonate reductase-like aldo/keto reductase